MCKSCKTAIGFTGDGKFYFQTSSGHLCLLDLKDIRFLCPNPDCRKPVRFQSKKLLATKSKTL